MSYEFTVNILELSKFQGQINTMLHYFFVTSYSEHDIFAESKFYFKNNQFIFDICMQYYDVVLENEEKEKYFNTSIIRFRAAELNDINATFHFIHSNSNDSTTLQSSSCFENTIEKRILDFLF